MIFSPERKKSFNNRKEHLNVLKFGKNRNTKTNTGFVGRGVDRAGNEAATTNMEANRLTHRTMERLTFTMTNENTNYFFFCS